VGGSVPNSQNTGKTATVTYVSGGASGMFQVATSDPSSTCFDLIL
jgi:hypothetical protein